MSTDTTTSSVQMEVTSHIPATVQSSPSTPVVKDRNFNHAHPSCSHWPEEDYVGYGRAYASFPISNPTIMAEAVLGIERHIDPGGAQLQDHRSGLPTPPPSKPSTHGFSGGDVASPVPVPALHGNELWKSWQLVSASQRVEVSKLDEVCKDLKVQAHNLLNAYSELGMRFHGIPIKVRFHWRLDHVVREVANTSFIISKDRVPPCMLTMLEALVEQIGEVERAFVDQNGASLMGPQPEQTAREVERKLQQASNLVKQGEQHLGSLRLAVDVLERMNWIIVAEGAGRSPFVGEKAWEMPRALKRRRAQRTAWLEALPVVDT